MDTLIELKHQSQLADARLGVARELGFVAAFFAGFATQVKTDSWALAAVAALVIYALPIWRYRRRSAQAEDRYHRAAGLGKYETGSGTSPRAPSGP